MDALWDEVKAGAYLAFRTLIPQAEDRIPLTFTTAIYPPLCYIPLVFMAYLARRPDTYPIRLLLLPTTISALLFAAYHFTWPHPALNVYNWAQCLLATVTIAKALEYALTKEGMLKVGESRPGTVKSKSKKPEHGSATNDSIANGSGHSRNSEQRHKYIPLWFSDAFELLHTCRGLDFKFGQNTYVPPFTRPLDSRRNFLKATLWSFIINYITLDLHDSLIKLFPGGIGTPLGGSMFYSSLPAPFPRYLVSTAVHVLTGSALLAGFNMVYDLFTLIAVALVGTSPISWPPLIDNPWTAQSMHELWGLRWHQALRQTFLVLGGYPGQWAFETLTAIALFPFTFIPRRTIVAESGKVGMLFGTFFGSAMFHECTMYSMNRGVDIAPVFFFVAQAFILIGERVWSRVTGKRVGGLFGRLWVYFIMFVLAQPMVNSWHRRGLGGGMVIPPFFSPVQIFLLPLIRKFLHWI